MGYSKDNMLKSSLSAERYERLKELESKLDNPINKNKTERSNDN